ncbi:unnamed protein product [Lupinus luteus]|uniref:Uncharacterized protein n=1 Tax=Lupinus luteus TaxID=3873 RepID=A0AAV1WYZ0_LUPLU
MSALREWAASQGSKLQQSWRTCPFGSLWRSLALYVSRACSMVICSIYEQNTESVA